MKPKFSIRDLCWLMLVVAVACMGWMERRRADGLTQEKAAALKTEQELRRWQDVLEKQLGHVQLKLAQEGYRFHFDIYQYPDGTTDVRFIDESNSSRRRRG